MPIEAFIPLALFLGGMVISHITSSKAMQVVEENRKGK
jgi:hypothetical protein